MKLKWMGHSCFLLTSNSGVKVLTDPYHWLYPFLKYKPLRFPVDIITISHNHFFHNKTSGFGANPHVIREPMSHSPRGIEIVGVPSYHDSSGGKKRGQNLIFRFSIDDIRFCHLGDLGHSLSSSQIGQIGKVDVLLAPVGGVSTAGVDIIELVCRQLKPKVIIPMHYRTNQTLLPLRNAESFLGRWDPTSVQRLNLSELDFRSHDMVQDIQVWLLKPALKSPKPAGKKKEKF